MKNIYQKKINFFSNGRRGPPNICFVKFVNISFFININLNHKKGENEN